jgi:hypothetical protein
MNFNIEQSLQSEWHDIEDNRYAWAAINTKVHNLHSDMPREFCSSFDEAIKRAKYSFSIYPHENYAVAKVNPCNTIIEVIPLKEALRIQKLKKL